MTSVAGSKATLTVPVAFGTVLTITGVTLLVLYTLLVVHVTKGNQALPASFQYDTRESHPAYPDQQKWRPLKLPALLIYRRTMKTGSSSMREALLSALQPHGYVIMPYKSDDLQTVLHHLYARNDLPSPNASRGGSYSAARNEDLGSMSISGGSEPVNNGTVAGTRFVATPPRVLLVQHNSIVRSVHPDRDAVIVDTLRPGYEQITSFCTHIQRVRSCDDVSAMEACLRSNITRAQNFYRWAGRSAEDEDTYIDVPLSSWHPALSTTVFRTVFPDAILNVDIYNERNSTCRLNERLKRLYDEYYGDLENQIRMLQSRMLVLAGYPTMLSKKGPGSVEMFKRFSVADMLDAAEQEERKKYPQLDRRPEKVQQASQDIQDFQSGLKRWYIDSDGNLRAGSKSEIAEQIETS